MAIDISKLSDAELDRLIRERQNRGASKPTAPSQSTGGAGGAILGSLAAQGINSQLGSSSAASLPMASQGANFMSGAPLNAVGSQAMADGAPGYLMADGSVIPQSSFTLADGTGTTVAVINGIDAINNIRNGDRRGVIEGGTTAAGTAAGYALGGPVGAGIGSVVGRTAGRGLAHVFGGGVTKREQENNTKNLLAQGFTEQQIAGRLNPDKSDPNYKKVPTEATMRDPSSMWGTYGMQSTFGPGYFNNMSEQDRWAVTQAAIDNNLLKGNKGDVIVTDQEKLLGLADAAKKNPLYADAYNTWAGQNRAPAATNAAPTSAPKPSSRGDSARPTYSAPTYQPVAQTPPTMMPSAPQPSLVTPEDFTNAYLGVYERNSGNQLFNPLARRF